MAMIMGLPFHRSNQYCQAELGDCPETNVQRVIWGAPLRIDPSVTAAFIETFGQYGNPQAPFMIVGPEEAGVTSLEDFSQRLDAWSKLGKPAVVDIADFHRLIGKQHLFDSARPPTQATWRRLITLLLTIKGEAADIENVRTYQRDRLGRRDGDVRMSELYPLPAKKRSDWIYAPLAENPALEFLATRKAYELRCAPAGKRRLRAELANRSDPPKAVIFYGSQQLADWSEIAGTVIDRPMRSGALYAQSNKTLFVAVPHPSYRAQSNNRDYWIETGHEIRELCDKLN
jgi:hypothetical protein